MKSNDTENSSVSKKKLIDSLLSKKFDNLVEIKGGSCSSIKIGCGPGYCHSCPSDGCLNNCAAMPQEQRIMPQEQMVLSYDRTFTKD